MKVLLVAGGKVNIEMLREQYEKMVEPYVIGVDHGTLYLLEAGIKVDRAIGDFDSVTKEELECIESVESIKVEHLNPVKDDTDTEHAFRYAIGLKPSEIICYGCTGSRLDQTMASINLLRLAVDAGVPAVIQDENNRIRVVKGKVTFSKEDIFGKYVSVIPYGDEITNLSEEGFKYEVQNISLGKVLSRGISNELVKDIGVISSDDYMIIMETRD